jgi:decaprenylphospho-beta-D-ribofuranose 2-oxidase
MLRVTSSWMLVDTERARDLDDLMQRLSDGDHRYRYSVAWIDCLARGARMGRGVLTRANHAPAEAVGTNRGDPLAFDAAIRLRAPAWVPSGLLRHSTVAAFNEVWFRKAPRHREGQLQRLAAYFHPLDMVADWNRIYGSSGVLQYQFAVPFGHEDVVRTAVERLSATGAPSFLAVLKRFADGDPGLLSFPRRGWTLALDVSTAIDGLGPLLDELDELVAQADGAIYLAKDARLRPELLGAMYPRLAEWRDLRARIDPHGAFSSDLSRRLHL